MLKNTAGQRWRVFAFNRSTGAPVTGDAANITAKISKDYGSATATTTANPTELEDGYYSFPLTQAETNANWLDIFPESSTAGVQVIGVPGGRMPQVIATGGGPRSVVITVTLSGAPVQGAQVSLYRTGEVLFDTTNNLGQVSFSAVDDNWTVAIYRSGCSFTPVSLSVNANTNVSYSLLPISITSPVVPGTSTGYGSCLNIYGAPEPNAVCVFQLISGPGTVGLIYSNPEVRKVADATGLVQYVGLIQGARYRYWKAGSPAGYKEFMVPLSPTFQLPELI